MDPKARVKKNLTRQLSFSEQVKKMVKEGDEGNEMWMDLQRKRAIAADYLTRIGEAKEWIEACLNEELPPITEFENNLRDGVYLAKMARFFQPEMVKKIYDETRSQPLGLRHSDNFNSFIAASMKVGLPKTFYFELTDLYDRKNMPRVIYMIHALSLYLTKLGLAPRLMKKKYKFTDEELAFASEQLGDIALPSFGDLASQLEKETGVSHQDEIEGLTGSYETTASELASWIDENTSNLQNREFNTASSEEVTELLQSLEKFRSEEKPPKAEEMTGLEGTFNKIQELLTADKKESYTPAEWMSLEKLRSEWSLMEDAERKREAALKLRLELATIEEKASGLRKWMKEQILDFSDRSYANSGTEELKALGEEIQTFREKEKPGKFSELQEFQGMYRDFEGKCQDEITFGAMAQKQREDLDKFWGDMEGSEKRREEDILFRMEMIKQKEGFTLLASGLRQWALDKTQELNVRDYDDKNSQELAVLIENLNTFSTQEKPPKAEEFAKVKEKYQEINHQLAAKEHSEFEPQDGTGMEEMHQTWEDLEKAENDRLNSLTLKLELAKMKEAYNESSIEMVEWIKAQIEKNNQRDFPKTSSECLKLANEEEHFRKTEKAKKEEQKVNLATDLVNIGAKIKKEGHSEWFPPQERSTTEITSLWAQLEKAERERASALANEMVRLGDEERLKKLHDHEQFWIKIQSITRGNEVRKRIAEMNKYYKAHEREVIKIQAQFRAKTAGEHYRALHKDNPPVATIQKFLHLLDDSDKDFEEELELEKLKQQVVVQIRENNERERAINTLDIKIALLIKNRTTLDDVVESTKKYLKKQKIQGEQEQTHGLKALDKETRQKLENYQHMFYLLQTQPKYFAGLIFQLKKKDRVQKFMETIVLTLFGYAQNDREEYLLLSLFKQAIEMEMSQVEEPQDILRGNPLFIKLVVQYTRGAKERQFLRDLLGPLVNSIIEQRDLDLEVDPLNIYRNMIKEEESRTGEKSVLPYDISRSQALENDKVMKIFVKRLKDLRAITDKFMNAIIASLPKLPYGLRYICSIMKKELEAKFGNEDDKITKVIGTVLYYRYLNPAVVAPEGFDVIETNITPMQRKSLGEISKMLQQISVGKMFEDEFFFLSALNDYITKAKGKFYKFFNEASTVVSPEEYFRIDKYDDFSKTSKPVIYISQEEIFATHALILEDLDAIVPEKDDPLRTILNDIGPPPEGSAEVTQRGAEMSLTLTNKFAHLEAEDTALKTLFVQTKRMVLSIIRIQQGDHLLDILQKPITPNDEKMYELQQTKEETQEKEREAKGSVTKSSSYLEIAGLTLGGLKEKTIQNMEELEKKGVVSKKDNYQEMLNTIAKDIKNKNRRRIQRKAELGKIRVTVKNLGEKTEYLEGQIKSYKEYVDSCVAAMSETRSTKKGNKKKIILPFTSQYFHEQKLKKEGKEYKFGSFKYTADKLFEKGVLVDLVGVPASQRGKVSITISSDEVGVFEVQGKFMGVQVDAMELRLDDLLQKQFDNVQVITLFGTAKVNVNLMVFLLNKKFYG